MKAPATLAIMVISAPLIVGCAQSSADYPSLAIRDFERVQGSFDAPDAQPVIAPAPLPEEKSARIAALRDQLGAAHSRFMAEAPSARSAVRAAAGTTVGDDRWGTAQVALASLDSQRSQAAEVLADFDLLFADTTLAFEQREDVGKARNEAEARLREEDAILAELRGAID